MPRFWAWALGWMVMLFTEMILSTAGKKKQPLSYLCSIVLMYAGPYICPHRWRGCFHSGPTACLQRDRALPSLGSSGPRKTVTDLFSPWFHGTGSCGKEHSTTRPITSILNWLCTCAGNSTQLIVPHIPLYLLHPETKSPSLMPSFRSSTLYYVYIH